MLNTHFTYSQLSPLIIGLAILVISTLTYKRNIRLALSLLVLGTIIIGFFAANLSHFLVLWDEQFHALVAKNLSKSPLIPTLYRTPILEYNHTVWTANHIWLHKQPLFLWQMALSVKAFGANELAVRIPSIILHAIIPLFIYRIGRITVNSHVGFIAAIIFACSYFPLELIVGRFSTDHNDVAFLFYVAGSFWAWFEYQRSKKLKYLLLIGVFSGGAMLTKWLMGALVFVLWSLTELITNRRELFSRSTILPMLRSAAVALIIFLPWQIYIHFAFPKESAHELAYNGKHFLHAVEDHSGPWDYHFTEGISKLYGGGDLIPFILIIGVVLLIYRSKELTHKVFILTSILFIYAFFTLAATKMLSFTLIAMPFIHLGLAALVNEILLLGTRFVKSSGLKNIISAAIIMLVGYISLNLKQIQISHTNWEPRQNDNWTFKTREKTFILSLSGLLPNKPYVIFNTNTSLYANIPIMFYTNHIAYMEIPTQKMLDDLKKGGHNLAVFEMGELPEYILEDASVLKITVPDDLIK